MYSTLLSDTDYDPLLIVYLTTTGAVLQNHVKAQLITGAIKQVVYREFGREAVPFNVLGEVRGSLESKRQRELDLQAEQRRVAQDITALNSVRAGSPATTLPGALPPLVVPPGAPPGAKPGWAGPLPGWIQQPGSPPWDYYRAVRGRPEEITGGYDPIPV